MIFFVFIILWGGVNVCCDTLEGCCLLRFYSLFIADAWKIDQLAQSLWYTDIMSDVSLRPESWFEWQTRLVWYSGLQDGEREAWREVARAVMDLLRCCERERGKD